MISCITDSIRSPRPPDFIVPDSTGKDMLKSAIPTGGMPAHLLCFFSDVSAPTSPSVFVIQIKGLFILLHSSGKYRNLFIDSHQCR